MRRERPLRLPRNLLLPQSNPGTRRPENEHANDQQSDDQGTGNDVASYKANSSGEDTAPSHGPLPYLGIAVHSTMVMQPNGTQRHALEVLSVDE